MSILSIDYGKKKIGVAFSDQTERIAFMDKGLRICNDKDLFENLKKIVIEKKINKLLIGIPYKNGQETEFTKEIRNFANDFVGYIKRELGFELEVTFIDEIMTSKIGSEFIVQKRGKNKKIKKFDTQDDNLAAWVMLSEILQE